MRNGPELSLGVDDLFHGGGAEGADQLVLQVCDAHVETQPFHLARERLEPSPARSRPRRKSPFLSGVTETRQPEIEPLRAEHVQESSDRLRPPDWYDGNALSVEIPATAPSQRFERALVADPLDEHDRARVGAYPRQVRCGRRRNTALAGRCFAAWPIGSLRFVHDSYLHSSRRAVRAPSANPGLRGVPFVRSGLARAHW